MSTTTGGPHQGAVADPVVEAALDIVGEHGFDALSMRRLSARVDMHLPALYRIFSNKQALVDEMADVVLGRAIHFSSVAESNGLPPIEAIAHGLRRALLAQRDGARIVGGSFGQTRNNLALIDRSVGTMTGVGFSGKTAIWAASTVFCYVLGEVIEQQGVDTQGRRTRTASTGLRGQAASSREWDEAVYDFDARFAFGLKTLLAGLQQNQLHET